MTYQERNQLEPGTIVKVNMENNPNGKYFSEPTKPKYPLEMPPFISKSEMELPIVSYNPSLSYTKFVVYRWEEPVYFEVNLNKIQKL